jgi:hypothetical protein
LPISIALMSASPNRLSYVIDGLPSTRTAII